MWVFLNDAALSIVAQRERPDCLLVRGRVAGDIEAVFPKAHVTVTPDADYRYRASVPDPLSWSQSTNDLCAHVRV